MYPGTYQPLSSMSLLLADLLMYPHSEEAATSQGLVDAIFDLYQVDQGMVSGSDPPRRRLSPTGREAWSMLGRVRKRALEQKDQDPHVVLPSFMASSNVCLCGERLVHEKLLEEGSEPPEMPPWDQEADGNIVNTRLESPQAVPDQEQMIFNWEEFDAYLGNSAGMMI